MGRPARTQESPGRSPGPPSRFRGTAEPSPTRRAVRVRAVSVSARTTVGPGFAESRFDQRRSGGAEGVAAGSEEEKAVVVEPGTGGFQGEQGFTCLMPRLGAGGRNVRLV